MATHSWTTVRLGPFLVVLAACGGESTMIDQASSGGTGGGGAGAPGGTGAGTGGTNGGGTSGSAGTGGSAGEPDCAPVTCANMDACAPVTPASDLITDFSNLDGNIFRASTDEWWLEFFGGPYVYPGVDACAAVMSPTVLSQDLSAESQHVTGTVGTWSGFGLWFAPCTVDLSAYSGISFTISGDAGPSGRLAYHVPTASNSVQSTDPRNPTCSPNVATCVPEDPEFAGASCRGGVAMIGDIGAEPKTVTVSFSDVTDGLPDDTPDSAEVVGIQFEFDWASDRTIADAYGVDVVLDDVVLVR